MALAMIFILYPSAVHAAAPRPTTPKITSVSIDSTTSMTLKWSRSSNSTGYQLFRAVSSKGRYTNVGWTNTASFTDRGLKKNKTYYYKVRAINEGPTGTVFSALSKPADMKMLTRRPTVTAKPAGTSQVKLSWKTVKGATGYQVLTSTGKASVSKRASVGKRLTYTKGGLTTGTKYYFRVRTYYKAGGVTYYGLPSAFKTATPALPKATKAVVNKLVRLTNEARRVKKLHSLKTDPVLMAMAQKRAEELSKHFSHGRPDGSLFFSIAKEFGFAKSLENECIAAIYNVSGDPAEVMFRSWKSSGPHWESIMSAEYGCVGAGYFVKGKSQYAVLLFAMDY